MDDLFLLSGHRGTKPSPNPAERAKSAITCSSTFEMKLADFPELGDITPSNPTVASLHQEPWVCAGAVMPAERQSSPAPICKVTFMHGDLGQRTHYSVKAQAVY